MDRFKSTIRKGGVKDGRNPGGVSFKHMGREGLIVLALGRAVPGLLRKAKSRGRVPARAAAPRCPTRSTLRRPTAEKD